MYFASCYYFYVFLKVKLLTLFYTGQNTRNADSLGLAVFLVFCVIIPSLTLLK